MIRAWQCRDLQAIEITGFYCEWNGKALEGFEQRRDCLNISNILMFKNKCSEESDKIRMRLGDWIEGCFNNVGKNTMMTSTQVLQVMVVSN